MKLFIFKEEYTISCGRGHAYVITYHGIIATDLDSATCLLITGDKAPDRGTWEFVKEIGVDNPGVKFRL